MKTALIMEGGAMRGMFTCGVLDVFLENGIEFDGAAGISAGATFGCNYKSKQIGRALRYNKAFSHDYRYGSFRSLLKSGDIYEAKFCYDDIPNKLDIFDTDTFEKNPMDFWVGTTDLETGKAHYYNCKNGRAHDITWIRASASIPVLSKIVEVDGYKVLDGGVADSVPYDFMMKEQGYDKSVTILTRENGFIKKKNGALWLIKMLYRKYPNFIKAMADRHIRYNELYSRMAEDEAAGKTIIIRPKKSLEIKQMEKDTSELERVYNLGREAALENLDKVKAFLSK